MKKSLCVIVFVLFVHCSNCQPGICDQIPTWSWSAHLGSTDFNGSSSGFFHYEVDTTLPNNLWQVGNISKAGFPTSTFANRAIQTDTSAPYATNNTSAFYVWTDHLHSYSIPDSLISITFWHYYDLDNVDSCMVQVTLDSGNSWLNYSDYQALGNLRQLSFDYQAPAVLLPYNSGKFLWNGISSGWELVKICFVTYGLKPQRSMTWPTGFRFLFKSDSVQTNKPGWVIDQINIRTPTHTSSVSDYNKLSLPIYPNPSGNGFFMIDFPSTYVTGNFFVYDFLGRNVKTVPLTERIDLSNLPSGLYSYKALFEKTNQWFSGKIEIR